MAAKLGLTFTDSFRQPPTLVGLSTMRAAALILAVCTLGVLIGGALGVGMRIQVLAFFALLSVAVLTASLAYQRRLPRMEWLFFVALFLIPATSLLHKAVGVGAYFLIELVIYGSALLTLPRYLTLVRLHPILKFLTVVLAAYIVWALLASVFGRSRPIAAVYQALSNLKPILLVLMGLTISWQARSEDGFWKLVQWFWLPLVVMVLWQWAHPGSYFALLGKADPGTAQHAFPLIPTKGLGVFQHASYLALYSGLGLLLSLSRASFSSWKAWILPSFGYGFLLLSSCERQEIAAGLLVMAIWAATVASWRSPAAAIFASVIAFGCAGVALWGGLGDQVVDEASTWGVSGRSAVTHPRPLMYFDSLVIAEKYFPFGSGLGTFGGAGAAKFDRSFYVDLGWGHFKWFYEKNVLMDTFWPNFLAETGWPGLVMMFLIIAAPLAYSLMMAIVHRDLRRDWLPAFLALLFLLAISPTSTSFQDPGLALIPFVLFGVAVQRSAVHRQEVQP